MSERIEAQMKFLNEAEKLKNVYRRNKTIDGLRAESSAEHSWHISLMAVVLLEHADHKALDVLRILKMLLVHDLVEIYAGDTWLYDADRVEDQTERESEAAQRLFAMLPADQAHEFLALWREFEDRKTPDALFAAAIDSLQPLSNHLLSGSLGGESEPIEQSAVLDRKRHIAESSRELWELAQRIIRESAARGLYKSLDLGSTPVLP